MPGKWEDIPLKSKYFANVAEAVLTKSQAALENGFINEAEGHSRFPGLSTFVSLTDDSPVYLHDWRGDLVAATGQGNVFRIDENGNTEQIPGVPVAGGRRVIFDKTDNELLMAAGDAIIRLGDGKTEVLSEDAPHSTHIGFIDGYVVAIEPYSGRFYHCEAGAYRTWNPLDVFSADGKPDNLNSLTVTPYRELLLCGIDSVEQFERLPSGDTPFFRRWAVGEGVFAPYTLLAADNGTWAVNKDREFVRLSGQISEPSSDDIGMVLEEISDDLWQDAWTAKIHIKGQKFILLQIPRAANIYGTQGITALYDYRTGNWTTLYGWDNTMNVPARWPGWSYYFLWGRHFVGGEGKIYELSETAYDLDGDPLRMLGRTAHYHDWGESRLDNLRMRVKRGVAGSNDDNPVIGIRARRDNKKWTRWKYKKLGLAGDSEQFVEFGGMGCAHTWQFEYMITDAADLDIVKLQAQVTPIGE